MVTTHVTTLISDSGYTRYNITTPVWNMFDETADPYWTFPEGLKLVQYDLKMKPDANMRCDSAIYFSNRRLWRLDGNVVMVNVLRDSFLTQQLYWDQVKAEVYSDSFIHIVRANHIIEGYGFTSNENMTAYTVHKPTAIIPVDRNKNNGGSGTGESPNVERSGDRPAAPIPASQRAGMQMNPNVMQATTVVQNP
jgi:LPS export ABC transporter protein LptC